MAKLTTKPSTMPKAEVKSISADTQQLAMLKKFGIIQSDIRKVLEDYALINYERSQLAQSIDRSLVHPLMSAASSIFADYSTVYSQLQNASIWCTTESKEYQAQIEKLFEIISIEEVIYDWAWTIATFGDLFVQIYGEPGVGIVSVSDDQHPINVSRVDYNGRLIGFYETPLGYAQPDERKLLTPWDYVHFRLLGVKRRRPLYADPMYSEFRTISIMTPDVRRLTSKYGTSILADALPTHKRLRLAEDSVLMARINRGVLRYIYKVGIPENNANAESVASLIDSYVDELKRARALNTDQNNPAYADRYNALSSLEDIILPVWGDVNNLAIDKVGGEVDIRWITDITELRNQLATALRVPLPLLAGYANETPPSLGQGSIERIDIRFARQSRRIQRAVINGLTRMIQIHLAYQGINPDLRLFTVNMSETSSAEEEELKDALDKGVDVVDKLSDLSMKLLGEENVDKKELLDYLNKKFLKLNDMDLTKILIKPNAKAFNTRTEEPVPGVEKPAEGETAEAPNPFKERQETRIISDFKSAIPLKENKIMTDWQANWEGKKVNIKPAPEKKS